MLVKGIKMAKRELPPPFTLTDKAQAHIAASLKDKPAGTGVRISLRNAGCSGFKYEFVLTDLPKPADLVSSVGGITFFVDTLAEMRLRGARLDYVTEGVNQTLDFVDNPNEEARCGCGESVTFRPNP